MVDYSGKEVSEKKVYKVSSIHGDKATLQYKGLIDIAAKITNIKRAK